MKLIISPRALSQLTELVTWWRANRTAAAGHLEDEFERVAHLVTEQPRLGRRYRQDLAVRVHPLRKTPYSVFYEVHEVAQEVRVVAVWSTMRQEPPPDL